ncbi:hypothetical protein OG401_21960 [Kitasatospora purpeofusca]|uniref:hypothetical protein n=1 Tax=Kitasatospora purpeofusca TaxID=67352 RepID=UPI00224C9554|nr:hypothetical protein [Kitasatospora purpeofusca]MCX4686938.1 hypothetical protein [Kitasatospora purpeofusca]WTA53127.1 hypothetical protein OIP63_20775 [Kitasatospora purpeofusca]
MRFTRSQATDLATSLDKAADDKTKAARSGDAHAANTTNSDLSRQQAGAAASILRGQADDMRADAAAIRDGADPTGLGY